MTFLELTDNDFRNNRYSYEQIIYSLNTSCPSLRVLNNYQKLSPYICAKYIVFGGSDGSYGDCEEDTWICNIDILKKQKHINEEELKEAHIFVKNEELKEKNELKLMEENDNKKFI